MKILFIGTVQFSLQMLGRLTGHNVDIIGVVSKKESPFNADFADLTPLCEKNGIPYLLADDINGPDALAWIRERNPDIIFCFGWSSILGKELLDLAPNGVIGFHPAALPRNRGRHPIIWALVLGLEETASTFFFMDEGADSGDILSQSPIAIGYEDDAASLYDKILETARTQLDDFVPKLAAGTHDRVPQDASRANTWRKRGQHDGKIDFRMPARGIYNLVRGLTSPYRGAHCVLNGKEHVVWKCSEGPNAPGNLEPGKVIGVEDNTITVVCGDGTVILEKHEITPAPSVDDYFA